MSLGKLGSGASAQRPGVSLVAAPPPPMVHHWGCLPCWIGKHFEIIKVVLVKMC